MFLAVELDDETRHALAAHLLEALPELPGKAVPPSNWHLTLRFLGWTEPPQADRILAELDQHERMGSFSMRLAGLGAFPKARRATVLWVGVSAGEEPLTQLVARCERAVQAAGFSAEDRPFHPHMTISRVRPPEDVTAFLEAVPTFNRRFTVGHVALYRSRLRSGGTEYEVVERVSL